MNKVVLKNPENVNPEMMALIVPLLEKINNKVMSCDSAKLYTKNDKAGSKISTITSKGLYATGIIGKSATYIVHPIQKVLMLNASEILDFVDADWERFEKDFGNFSIINPPYSIKDILPIKIPIEFMVPYFTNNIQLSKILTEDLNDLTIGTTVYAYVREKESSKSLTDMNESDIAWLDINHTQYRKLDRNMTFQEYKSWIHDEPKVSLKIRDTAIVITKNNSYAEYKDYTIII